MLEHTMKRLDGEGENLAEAYKGKVLMVDRDGNVVAKYEAGLNPENPAIVNEIEKLLE